ncbi:lamin tail domain-containing protein, partial [Mycobacterium tuberculosis]
MLAVRGLIFRRARQIIFSVKEIGMGTRLTSRMKKWVSVVLAATLIVQLALGIAGERVAEAADGASAPNHLIIHQVYGGGGKSETPFTHSFIELYNPTNNTIDLSEWTIDYSSSRGGTHLGSTSGGEWVSLSLN